MMYTKDFEKLAERLESVVDQVGMSDTLYVLAQIAWAKAEHLVTNWQDRETSKLWERVAQILESASEKAASLVG